MAGSVVLGLFPGMGAPGGIQRACRHASAVLARLAQERGWQCRLLSLNDPAGEQAAEADGLRFSFEGFARGKFRFLRAASDAGRNATLVFAAHPNLAPVGWAVKKRTGARLAVLAWGIEVWEPLPLHRRWALRKADAVLAISRYTADQLVRVQQVDAARVEILPLGLEPAFWERARAEAQLPPPENFPRGSVLLTVTRLDASEGYKGVDTVIEALPRLAALIPDVHYAVVGDGDDRPRLEALSRKLDVAERVSFLGRVDSAEVLARCYANCQVFVMPSRGEGFGMVFLEAMAFGKPVVGGAHGGTPDVIAHGETGYLVPHGDASKLAEVLAALLLDPGLRARLGAQGRRRVEEKFLFRHFAGRLRESVSRLSQA
jgi:glycosyltransferase involved in cell wall biosynthesis